MDQINENKVDLMQTIKKYGELPINPARAAFLSNCWAAYRALCLAGEVGTAHLHEITNDADAPDFDLEMAQEWTNGMKNADGTKGPHFSMNRVKEIMKEHQVDCDSVEFYAALNSVYSDFSEALKENNASSMKVYVSLAKAWIDDQDAVHNKAAAYYTYVMRH